MKGYRADIPKQAEENTVSLCVGVCAHVSHLQVQKSHGYYVTSWNMSVLISTPEVGTTAQEIAQYPPDPFPHERVGPG